MREIMPADFTKYKDIFLSEAKTLIKAMNNALLELEKSPGKIKKIQEIIRAAHTFKGLAATMNYLQSVNLCHGIEDVLEAVRNGAISLDKCIDILFQCFDFLNATLKALEKNESELNSEEIIQQLKSLLVSRNNSSSQVITPVIPATSIHHEKIQAIEVKVDRLDSVMNLAEELLVSKMKFDSIREQIDHPELSSAVEGLGRLITDLQYQVMQIRLVPIGFIFNRFLRMIRDIAKQQKKEINVVIDGGEIELDRLLLDEIGESIVHLIRNAVDHGIELPESRKKIKKPAAGTIKLMASRTKEKVIIAINDDGAGLDLQTIKDLAIKQKILTSDASDEDVIEAIFSTLSTKKTITAISGRGLGLSIIKQKIESIGGRVRVETVKGMETTFFLDIPLSLAIIRALFVKVAGEVYAIPLDAVERLLVVDNHEFKGFMQYEAIIFEDDDIPIIRLSVLFGNKPSQLKKLPVVVIQKDGKRLGLVVDELLSTQEIIIKPLNKSIRNNKYFSGAAMIGSGQMILILDVAYLLPTKTIAQYAVPDLSK